MIDFNFKGIRIEVIYDMEQYIYNDADNRRKTRFERNTRVIVSFWDFPIYGLYELSFVKSTLNYFMQGYWKRSGKEGSKIDLAKVLHHEDAINNRLSLYFVSRQKNKKHSLQICLQKNGNTSSEIYLDGQEVLMLDIAIGKIISILAPVKISSSVGVF